MKKHFRAIFILLFFLALNSIASQTTQIKNAAEFQLALQKLNVLGSVLYVGAHPDDENTGLMAYFSKERKYRTAYLSLTRGDGGQNLIGAEKGVEIGIIRTQELLEARKIDGGEQFFTRAVDFGYSKSAEESMDFWKRDSVFADVVFVIRKFRPDVIITRFPADGNGGHGHHTASALLTIEAFKAAADPNVFPEQIRYVKPWQAKRLFWNSWRPGQDEIKGLLSLDVGAYNPLLGKAYNEIAAESRSMHKSQGFGSTPNRGPRIEYFQLISGEPARSDIFEGINSSWNRISNGSRTGEQITNVLKSFNPSDPSASLDKLVEIYREINKLQENEWIHLKKQELLELIKYSAGLWMEASASDYAAAPGDEIKITTTLISRGTDKLKVEKIEFPDVEPGSDLNVFPGQNQPYVKESNIHLPQDFPVSQPYWLRETGSEGLFRITDQSELALAQNPPAVYANISAALNGESISFTIPVIYKWNDRVEGELKKPFYIYPKITADISEKVAVFNGKETKELQVKLKSFTPQTTGELHIHAGNGWQAEPSSIPFSFDKKYDEQTFTVKVTSPRQSGSSVLSAELNIENDKWNKSLVEISHKHIEPQVYFPESKTRLVKLDINKPEARIGYIMGSGDEIPGSLANLGYEVTLLTDVLLEKGDLSKFDAIIAGIRAYNTRERLTYAQPRLLKYVENGGTFIVQYNVASDLHADIGPYPLKLGRDRVSVEQSPVEFISPDHQLLNFPNKITADDFSGWVQERGLYFAQDWDPRYEAMLSSSDPGEQKQNGGMLFARYGKGAFIYSGYSWFRQLPAGVQGAYRIFVNMISAGKYERNISN